MSAGSESELSSCSGDGAVPFTGCKHVDDHRLWKFYENNHQYCTCACAHVCLNTMTEFRS